MTNKSLLFVLYFACFSNSVFAQKQVKNVGYYEKELQSLQTAIDKNFYDQASGYYFVVVDPAQRENKNGYLREYTYLWSLCALYQAAK